MLLSRPQSSSSTIGPVHGGAISGYREREAPAPFNLSAIGAILKDTRERRGISIVGAAEKLFVKTSTLKAIESGQWVSLPHSVYVKGYIRSYASYLDILDAVEKGLS